VVVNFDSSPPTCNPERRTHPVDTTFWGGIRPCIKPPPSADDGLVSQSHFGRLASSIAIDADWRPWLPNLGYAADAHIITHRRR